MEKITVKSILVKWLKDNKYDGLFNNDCGCSIGDLAPCGDLSFYCRPGVGKEEEIDGELHFIIGPKTEPQPRT